MNDITSITMKASPDSGSLEDVLRSNIDAVESRIETVTARLKSGELDPTDEVLEYLHGQNNRHEMLVATLLQIDFIQIIPIHDE